VGQFELTHYPDLQGFGVIDYLPVAVSGPVLIEKFRPEKDHRSIGKPNHYAVVTTVYVQYEDGIMGGSHTPLTL
jgi:hypothetical protein